MRMRIKDVVTLRNEKTKLKDNYIGLENIISWDAKYIPSDIEPEGTNAVFKSGDILFGKLRPYLAKGFIPNYSGVCSTEFLVMAAKKTCLNKFLLYTFLSPKYIGDIKNKVKGVKMPRTSWYEFSSMEIEIPTIKKQEQIVKYLDSKLSEIDSQVNLLTSKRDAYLRLKKSIINHAVTKGLNPEVKMKVSGVDWIGEIPGHWERKRLKDIAYLYSGLTGKAGDDFRCDDISKTKPYIPFTNILNNLKIDAKKLPRVVMSAGENQNKVRQNDLLFLMSSEDYESIAKSAVVMEDMGEVYLNSFCRGLHFTSNKIYANFINFQLQAQNYRDALRFEARGFTRINIKVDKISSMYVSLPPLSEQKAIATYLDEKCSKIDKLVANIEKQISLYTDMKRSLIDEVITGKRAV